MSNAESTANVLTVIADANILVHGKSFVDAPWEEFGRDEIEVLYVPPVIREIDKLKVQTGRPNKLARKISGEIRGLMELVDKSAVVRQSGPRVVRRVCLRPVTKRADESLDLTHADQLLINYALTLKAEGRDVVLLTDDTICAATAEGLGLSAKLVGDHWLRDPEPDERDRENARLKEEVRRLASAEPRIDIEFKAKDGTRISELEVELTKWPELTSQQVEELMAEVEQGCPMATSFERAKESVHPYAEIARLATFGGHSRYTPPTEAEIEAYKSKDYPAWLNSVRLSLKNLHNALEGQTEWPRFSATAANNGSRPAEDVLVKVRARGDIEIENIEEDEDSDEKPRSRRSRTVLPLPPEPPRGKTEVIDPLAFLNRRPEALIDRHLGPLPGVVRPRDADRFYWRSGRTGPGDIIQLECACWRHSERGLDLDLAVRPYAMKETTGAVEYEVHASNLSAPRMAKLPVRISAVKGDTMERARRLVQSLIQAAKTENRL